MKFVLPDVETTISLEDSKGQPLGVLEVIDVDCWLSLSQEGLSEEERKNGSWIPVFQARIREKINIELSPTICWLLAGEAAHMIQELKKSFGSSPTSFMDTESTPSGDPSPTG